MERVYVKVLAEIYQGQVKPVEILVEDQRIPIKKILYAQQMKSRKDYAQDAGMRYVVRSDHREFVLVYDQRWWVELN